MYKLGILVLTCTVLYWSRDVLVHTSTYHFAQSCPGVQDSRCSEHLRSEMSDRHGPASRTEDTICPTAQRRACVMRPDSESRCRVADGVVDQCGRPALRPVSAETSSPACRGAAETCGETPLLEWWSISFSFSVEKQRGK